MNKLPELIRTLLSHGVEFILVGGVAAIAHGTARATYDLDVVYLRTRSNIQRLVACLATLSPYLRGAPPGLPFRFDEETVQRGLNFTLTTNLGALDLLGEIAGGGRFEEVQEHTFVVEVFGSQCLCLDLPTLIKTKRAAGRVKDLEPIAELEALLEEKRKLGESQA